MDVPSRESAADSRFAQLHRGRRQPTLRAPPRLSGRQGGSKVILCLCTTGHFGRFFLGCGSTGPQGPTSSNATATGEAPGSRAQPPGADGAESEDAPVSGPRGLHHLSVVNRRVCALDEAGALWCYYGDGNTELSESNPLPPWLHHVERAPAMRTLEPQPFGALCGIAVDGRSLCIDDNGNALEVEGESASELGNGLARSASDEWMALRQGNSRHPYFFEPLPALGGLDIYTLDRRARRLMVRLDGELAVRNWDTVRATRLPLSTSSNIVAAIADPRPCVVLENGEVHCWNESGELVTPHSSSGGALHDIELVSFQTDSRASVDHLCVPTRSAVACDSVRYGHERESLTLPFADVRDIESERDMTCLLDSEGISCLTTGLRDPHLHEVSLPGRARSIAVTNEGACAILESGALVCWGSPFSNPSYWPGEVYGDDGFSRVLRQPTVIIPAGVSSLVLGRGWCLTMDGGETVCAGSTNAGDENRDNPVLVPCEQGAEGPCIDGDQNVRYLLEESGVVRGSSGCFLREGRVFCWGKRTWGLTGRPWSPTAFTRLPVGP